MTSQLETFAKCLYEPTDIVEIRLLDDAKSTWCTAAELHEFETRLRAANERGQNIYAGANPRRAKGGRKTADVALARCLFADFDHCSLDEARSRIASLPPPTLLTNSGHGFHAYWRLGQPLTDLGEWANWQRDLIQLCQSDPSVHDPPRIMRLPSFTNHKEPAAVSAIIEADPSLVYELCDLHDLIPHIEDEPAKTQTPVNGNGKDHGLGVLSRAAAYLSKVPGAVEGNNGDDFTFRVCCQLVNDFGLSADQAWPLLQAWNRTCTPPWSDRDLRAKLEHAMKYAKGTPRSKAEAPPPSRNGQARGQQDAQGDYEPLLVPLAGVQDRKPSWLWRGKIPLGSLTLLVGDPGRGKSTLTCALAATVSRGAFWPDGSACDRGNVIIMSAEDSLEFTVVPRLKAADADLNRIDALQGIKFNDPETGPRERPITLADVDTLRRALAKRPETRLLIVDPVSAFMGKADSHVNAEVRGVVAPIAALADEFGVAVIVVSHLNKTNAGPAMYRAMGSLGFIAAARAAWGVCEDKQDANRKLLLPIKMNLARMPDGLAFTVQPSEYDQDIGVVHWGAEPVRVSADEALSDQKGQDRSVRDEAADWLRNVLADGPVKVEELKKMARADGISERTLRRAKDEIGVQTPRVGFGRGGYTTWAMPDHTCPPSPIHKKVDNYEEYGGGLANYGDHTLHTCPPPSIVGHLSIMGQPGPSMDDNDPAGQEPWYGR